MSSQGSIISQRIYFWGSSPLFRQNNVLPFWTSCWPPLTLSFNFRKQCILQCSDLNHPSPLCRWSTGRPQFFLFRTLRSIVNTDGRRRIRNQEESIFKRSSSTCVMGDPDACTGFGSQKRPPSNSTSPPA
ncbi:hypothetical protein E1B28_009147 [Marasmius oreades]|uniref:Uncharacterized protein n=1 Tax=Marasmius oreades TaxID=181124 RepID=A0A9P7S007_9AGAR|nr:uncharacterized protein E1B28_009147 [Marasmius oreades]KAG7092832.1 hypothetical protein E1B28_009147 [Marasmius oreades]